MNPILALADRFEALVRRMSEEGHTEWQIALALSVAAAGVGLKVVPK